MTVKRVAVMVLVLVAIAGAFLLGAAQARAGASGCVSATMHADEFVHTDDVQALEAFRVARDECVEGVGGF